MRTGKKTAEQCHDSEALLQSRPVAGRDILAGVTLGKTGAPILLRLFDLAAKRRVHGGTSKELFPLRDHPVDASKLRILADDLSIIACNR
jgi:hypothetical protein